MDIVTNCVARAGADWLYRSNVRQVYSSDSYMALGGGGGMGGGMGGGGGMADEGLHCCVITSAKEVMFLPVFVCLFVCRLAR